MSEGSWVTFWLNVENTVIGAGCVGLFLYILFLSKLILKAKNLDIGNSMPAEEGVSRRTGGPVVNTNGVPMLTESVDVMGNTYGAHDD